MPIFLKSASIPSRTHETGVASVEYAILASLIAIAILIGLGAMGDANDNIWTNWTARVISALSSI